MNVAIVSTTEIHCKICCHSVHEDNILIHILNCVKIIGKKNNSQIFSNFPEKKKYFDIYNIFLYILNLVENIDPSVDVRSPINYNFIIGLYKSILNKNINFVDESLCLGVDDFIKCIFSRIIKFSETYSFKSVHEIKLEEYLDEFSFPQLVTLLPYSQIFILNSKDTGIEFRKNTINPTLPISDLDSPTTSSQN